MANSGPSVSIAIPVFNGEAYLAEALECLAAQSLGDFEAIILDNASTDRTRGIAASFAARDPRFRVITQPENLGAMPNYVAGLAAATGEFFMWRAFDDLSDPNYIETLRAALTAAPGAALATGRVRMVNMDGSNERLIGYPALTGNALGDCLRLMFSSHAGWFYGLWRREALEGPFNAAMRHSRMAWGNDHLALLPFLWRGQVVHAPDALFHQRLKKTAGAPKRRNPVSFQAMRAARHDFARCYLALLREYGPASRLRAWALAAAMPLYREKRCYRLGKLLSALIHRRF